jgi:hypothetical protein
LPHSLPENQVLLSSKTHSVGGKESKAFLMADSSNGKQDARQSVSFGGFVVDNYMMSPISKINFSQSLIEKVVLFLHFIVLTNLYSVSSCFHVV